MRTILSFVFAVLFVAAFSQVTFAQSAPEGGLGPGPGFQQGDGKEITPEKFSEMKSHFLKMLGERRAWLDQETACVQAATNAAELRKCKPERPMMGQGHRCEGCPGNHQPPTTPLEKPQ